jgi:hypothetical protein
MINSKLLKILSIAIFAFSWSCSSDSTSITATPARDHAVQFLVEEKLIEQFLKEYYPVITYNSNGDVANIQVKKVQYSTDLSFASFYHANNTILSNGNYKGIDENVNESILPTTYPVLIKKNFFHQGTIYSYWYFMVKPGAVTKIPYGYTQATSARPTEYDGVILDYKGYTLKEGLFDSTIKYALSESSFETTNYPAELRLTGVVRGFSRILPKFGSSSTTTIGADGSVTYQGYGAGVMIFPSGMGYYNVSSTIIPAYSPLLFSFNLYDVKRFDQDQDGVMNFREDINRDGYFYASTSTLLNDDTDNDGTNDALDYDDDGDGIITFLEVKNPNTGIPFLDSEYDFLSLPDYTNNSPIKAYLNINYKRQ